MLGEVEHLLISELAPTRQMVVFANALKFGNKFFHQPGLFSAGPWFLMRLSRLICN
jgi:hypothetical protein